LIKPQLSISKKENFHHKLDLEEAVLGAMMIDKKVLMRLLIYYKPMHFTKMLTNIFLKQFSSYSQIPNQ
jgi:replicative DNA helicase